MTANVDSIEINDRFVSYVWFIELHKLCFNVDNGQLLSPLATETEMVNKIFRAAAVFAKKVIKLYYGRNNIKHPKIS